MEFYHVLNRGINKNVVFREDGDRMRFIKSLYVFNDFRPTPNGITQHKLWMDESRKRNCLIHIHAWCLMHTHYHLLVTPIDDNLDNLSLFMKKLNGGYAKFFNEKYERSGYFWQGKYKKIQIERDNQFMYIPYYIHLNPLDIKFKEWREGALSDFSAAEKFLDSYKWSSWYDYTGRKNFPSILYKDVLGEILGSKRMQLSHAKTITSDDLIASESSYIET